MSSNLLRYLLGSCACHKQKHYSDHTQDWEPYHNRDLVACHKLNMAWQSTNVCSLFQVLHAILLLLLNSFLLIILSFNKRILSWLISHLGLNDRYVLVIIDTIITQTTFPCTSLFIPYNFVLFTVLYTFIFSKLLPSCEPPLPSRIVSS